MRGKVTLSFSFLRSRLGEVKSTVNRFSYRVKMRGNLLKCVPFAALTFLSHLGQAYALSPSSISGCKWQKIAFSTESLYTYTHRAWDNSTNYVFKFVAYWQLQIVEFRDTFRPVTTRLALDEVNALPGVNVFYDAVDLVDLKRLLDRIKKDPHELLNSIVKMIKEAVPGHLAVRKSDWYPIGNFGSTLS